MSGPRCAETRGSAGKSVTYFAYKELGKLLAVSSSESKSQVRNIVLDSVIKDGQLSRMYSLFQLDKNLVQSHELCTYRYTCKVKSKVVKFR